MLLLLYSIGLFKTISLESSGRQEAFNLWWNKIKTYYLLKKKSLAIVKSLLFFLAPSCACHNCLFLHRFPAALSEMLVQSTGTDLYLLPALPRNKWPHGCVKGLKARGGVTVNISWKEGSLHEALLWSSSGLNSLAKLHYGDQTATISISSGQVYRFSRDLKCLKTWTLWWRISASLGR